MIKGFDMNDRRFEPDDCGSFAISKSKRSFEGAFGRKIGDEAAPHFLVWDGQPNEEDDRKGHKKRDSHPIINKFEPDDCGSFAISKSKRSFEGAFGRKIGDEAAPHFLVWDGQPNEEDDRKGHKKRDSHPIINKSESDEESYIVGWPPITSSRKRELILQNNGGRVGHHQIIKKRTPLISMAKNIMISGSNSSSPSIINNSMYVKVKMEGVPIARKIDLTLHNSYYSLKNALITMFTNSYDGKCTEDRGSYRLTYQDKEGDWLLAGDVPWKSFIKSVQRLEIARNGG
ncbi:Auxin-responsive protein IAA29 [Morus notabilis]|uniref:Auxin-responsive protein n=1 Tax=Morus notabilis TaxID=981085 RepID=W9QLC6_9ROSA|nr:Auxin-responsive protein IAA29 [Morus notabilis]